MCCWQRCLSTPGVTPGPMRTGAVGLEGSLGFRSALIHPCCLPATSCSPLSLPGHPQTLHMAGRDFQWSQGKVTQSCPTLCDPMDHTVHGILQARILEWVAVPFSRGSSQPRDQTQVSCIAGRFFTSWATRKRLPGTVKMCSYLPGWEGSPWKGAGQQHTLSPAPDRDTAKSCPATFLKFWKLSASPHPHYHCLSSDHPHFSTEIVQKHPVASASSTVALHSILWR